MTDADLVLHKLGLVETYVRELRTLARPDEIDRDVRERRFIERTLQVAIQSCQDVEKGGHDPPPAAEGCLIGRRSGWGPPTVNPGGPARLGYAPAGPRVAG
jgi:hypothetical protein